MVKMPEKEDWDLSSIIDLISSLSVPEDVHLVTDIQTWRFKDLHDAPLSEIQEEKDESRLGNFDEIWKLLELPRDTPPPKVNPSLKVDPCIFSGPEDIHVTGDDSSNDNSNAKAVRWRDEAEGADLEDNDQQEGPNLSFNGSGLTKSQRKKQRRKLQKERENEANCTAHLSASGVQSDSISDTDDNNQHNVLNSITNNSGLTVAQQRKQRRKFQKACKYEALSMAQLAASGIQSDNVADTEDNNQQDGLNSTTNGPGLTKPHKKKQRKKLEKEAKYEALCAAQLSASGFQSDSAVERQSKTRRALIQQITNGTPAQGQFAPHSENLSRAFEENCRRNGIAVANSPSPLVRTQSAPIISAVPPTTGSREVNLSVAATKKATLLSKLKAQFVEERPFLENLTVLQHSLTGNDAPAEGIHVFIDISNVGSLQLSSRSASNLLDPHRLPRRSQTRPRALHTHSLTPPNPLLPQSLPGPRARPPHRQTRSRRLRQH